MALSPAPVTPTLPLDARKAGVPQVEDRYTPELVIALVGLVGSGVSTSAQIIAKMLRDDFGYRGQIIRVSDAINAAANSVEEEPAVPGRSDRTETLQKIGTKIREKFGPTRVIDLVIGNMSRERDGSSTTDKSDRRFTIIDSLKHPDEVARLAHVYGQAFWLVGIFAPEDKRKERLSNSLGNVSDLARVMARDEDERNKQGQRVRDTIHIADYFIRNDSDNDEKLNDSIRRFLDVIFGISVQTPTLDESAMYAAASTASRSACLSRQVGAVITNQKGEIIGSGSNDVPKSGGGLYTYEDGKGDNRCYKWKSKVCHNDTRKDGLKNQIINGLLEKNLLRPDNKDRAEEIIFSTDLKQLIEFSRAVHAEMEAIISVARCGNQTTLGASLYTTTYPCHSCARHIVAAGINRVVYIEPYAKSLATDLHSDAISTLATDKKKVNFLQYEGMAPKNLLRVFRSGIKRKELNGKAIIRARVSANPLLREHVDSFARREKLVAGSLAVGQNAPLLAGGNVANEPGPPAA